MEKQYDFVSIGDTVTDAFIRLKDAAVNCDINKEHCTICMRFGDKIPYEEVYIVPAVGNSANAAVAASRLGLSSALVTNLGDDRWGEDCRTALKGNGVAADFIVSHPGRKTNYHYVLWFEDDRTILVKHEDYPYRLPDIGEPAWMYLSSMGESAKAFHNDIEAYLKSHPSVKLAFQPGTFQIKASAELSGLYARTDIFIANQEEYERVLGVAGKESKELLSLMHAKGPKTAIMTDGPKGAYASDGKETWFMPPYPDPKPPYERTGAGDAFASTLVSALILGLPLKDALRWAPINAMAVVQKVGAQEGLLTRQGIEKYLASAPADYHPRAL